MGPRWPRGRRAGRCAACSANAASTSPRARRCAVRTAAAPAAGSAPWPPLPSPRPRPARGHAAEIRVHEAEARRRFALVRRLSLPRSMLGRLVEVAVVLDRAAALAEAGGRVTVATVFTRAATPRNLAIFASREGALPEVTTEGVSSC